MPRLSDDDLSSYIELVNRVFDPAFDEDEKEGRKDAKDFDLFVNGDDLLAALLDLQDARRDRKE